MCVCILSFIITKATGTLVSTPTNPRRRRGGTWPVPDFRESFFKSCGGSKKGKKIEESCDVSRGSRESCGWGSSRGLQICEGEKIFAFLGSKKSHFLGKSRAARARKPKPYLTNQAFVQSNPENENPTKITYSIPDLLRSISNI